MSEGEILVPVLIVAAVGIFVGSRIWWHLENKNNNNNLKLDTTSISCPTFLN